MSEVYANIIQAPRLRVYECSHNQSNATIATRERNYGDYATNEGKWANEEVTISLEWGNQRELGGNLGNTHLAFKGSTTKVFQMHIQKRK